MTEKWLRELAQKCAWSDAPYLESTLRQVWNEAVEECAKAAENTPTTLCQNGDFLSERCASSCRALKIEEPKHD